MFAKPFQNQACDFSGFFWECQFFSKKKKGSKFKVFFVTEFFPDFGKCIFQQSVGVKTETFLSVQTILRPVGNNIKFGFSEYTSVTCMQNCQENIFGED